ncbi:MAG: glycogen phosphorylase [Clostridiales bacterium]|nr:glycogen phosphorylase [Clostridiales bacterium]
MYIFEKITVVPELPERIKELNNLAYNLWWSWHSHLATYNNIIQQFHNYMNATNTWFDKNFPDKKDKTIAYFSAEYGISRDILHNSLTQKDGKRLSLLNIIYLSFLFSQQKTKMVMISLSLSNFPAERYI